MFRPLTLCHRLGCSISVTDLEKTAKLLQLHLSDPMNYRPPGSSVHGILQQEYWSGPPCPPLGDLPDPRIELTSLTSLALAGDLYH